MAAAYAALLSVRHIIQELQNHPRPSISLDKPQTISLIQNFAFLLDFLEQYSPDDSPEADVLEGRMTGAAYAAEDLIETHLVDQIDAHGENPNSNFDAFYQDLQRVVGEMELIKNEITKIITTGKLRMLNYSVPPPAVSGDGGGSSLRGSSSSIGHTDTTMVGCDDVIIDAMDKLTHGESSRQVIPIVGMGGIGKTTLAKNVYVNPLIVQYFDFRGWATISQSYHSKEILLELLVCLKTIESKASSTETSEHDLGLKLYQTLSGRRYLVVMDDMWSIEAFDKVKFYFPDNDNGSRIVVTTRLSNLASQLSGSCSLAMSFLDEQHSWDLFRKTAFGEQACPLEFENLGKRIARSCRGLPMSITVIGALLSKHKQSREYWEHVSENLIRILNSEEEHCMKILRLSYVELPIHLKPCFLYMGIFGEDNEIAKSRLVKLWAAEGFVKPISSKCLEMVAEDYLQDLVDRNLVLLHKRGSSGNIKSCKIHDLCWDLCLKEGRRTKFLSIRQITDPKIHEDGQERRRIRFSDPRLSMTDEFDIGQSSSVLRSLIWPLGIGTVNLRRLECKLLRVLTVVTYNPCIPPDCLSAHLRFLEIFCVNVHRVASSFEGFLLRALLALNKEPDPCPHIDIWKMPRLRHVNLNKFCARDPPREEKALVLGNLQTLKGVMNFRFGEEVVRRIPNIKKLAIEYNEPPSDDYCLDNLCLLTKLECLSCNFDHTEKSILNNISCFPHSLRKLTLGCTGLRWDEVETKIGRLPLLQVLKLCNGAVVGPEWEPVEGHFLSLKYLKIAQCNVERWVADSSHFPRLEHLVLVDLFDLEEIPLGIGDIPTLESIRLSDCSHSVTRSAKAILAEQEELGNTSLQLLIGK